MLQYDNKILPIVTKTNLSFNLPYHSALQHHFREDYFSPTPIRNSIQAHWPIYDL
jgi:hypothetical protein